MTKKSLLEQDELHIFVPRDYECDFLRNNLSLDEFSSNSPRIFSYKLKNNKDCSSSVFFYLEKSVYFFGLGINIAS